MEVVRGWTASRKSETGGLEFDAPAKNLLGRDTAEVGLALYWPQV